MKVGILTGGGDCPGLNAVIRAVTRKALDVYGYEVVHAALTRMEPAAMQPDHPLGWEKKSEREIKATERKVAEKKKKENK